MNWWMFTVNAIVIAGSFAFGMLLGYWNEDR